MTDAPTPVRYKPKPHVETIGGRALKPSTLMMGHGYDPTLSEGSLKPPIFLTSTFAFESAAAGKRFFEGVTGKRLNLGAQSSSKARTLAGRSLPLG